MADGRWLGRYEILKRLDANENDELLLARAHGPAGFQQPVVLKRHLVRAAEGAPHLARLAREAFAYALVTHPAVVRLYDFVHLDGYPVLVLEHVHGLSLAHLVRALRGRRVELPDAVALYIGHEMFSALAAAHHARNAETGEFVPVIHRDVNPRNVLVAWTGDVKLGNFGIAKVGGGQRSDLTAPGTLHGTYGYMAPEQVLGDPLTVRTDVYMAALVLWELLARRRAFEIDGIAEFELLKQMAAPALPALATLRPGLDASLRHAVRVALSVHPDRRSLSAVEMASCIEEVVDLRAARAECGRLASSVRETIKRTPPESQAILAVLDQSGETESFRAADLPQDQAAAVGRGVTSMPTPMPPSLEPLARSFARSEARKTGRGWSTATLAGAALLAVAIGFGTTDVVSTVMRRRAAAQHARSAAGVPATAPDAAATASLRPPVAPSAAPAALPSDAASSPAVTSTTSGRIIFPPRATGHRVFVDGRVIGEGAGASPSPCGRHVVRIGTRGKDQFVDVPCGGEVQLE